MSSYDHKKIEKKWPSSAKATDGQAGIWGGYDHQKIESKWQKKWEEEKTFRAQDKSKKPKYYTLIEFPYPSGDGLHVGHPRPYIGMDLIARKRRFEGFNVLYPIGWDAFGLPTENFAIKTGRDPREVTKENTDTFRRQIKSLGLSFDWSREINTTDPKYYKWTQWIFLQLYKHGLAYKGKAIINWCPKDKIGLANEEVVNGKCERCGTPVEKREKEQWILAITKYADRLDKDLDSVDYLPQIKTQQRNWIGRSEGAEISFLLNFTYKPEANKNRGPNGEKAQIPIFTTRSDTIFGATYLVLAPEHLWVTLAADDKHDVLQNKEEVKAYLKSVKSKTDIERTAEGKEKNGMELKGVKAINPANGEEIPMFVADYVLPHYGTGAIMAVPAHDERDFQFAKKYQLPVREVIEPHLVDNTEQYKIKEKEPTWERPTIIAVVKHWSEDKYICMKWKHQPWKTFVSGGREEGETLEETVRREVKEETGYLNIKSIKPLGEKIHSLFWGAHKNSNIQRSAQPVLVELLDGEKVEISEEEKGFHDMFWIDHDKVPDFISYDPKTFDGRYLELVWGRVNGRENLWTGGGILINSGKFDGMTSEEARKAITKFVGGELKTTYKLRDWIFSRQRYWGEPIPIIKCDKCGYVPVPEKDLPVELPPVKNYQPTDTGESPLAAITDWVNVKCPKCKGEAKRETDVMPNWAGSSWYFLRYTDPHNDKEFASQEKLKYWLGDEPAHGGVNWYNGGMEHTTLHLLYSRFWHKFLFDLKLVPTNEPYAKRTSHNFILAPDGKKMSKSLGNVINPDDIVEKLGADTLRLYEMFMGPFDQAVAWSTDGIVGPRRFLEKIWNLQEKISDKESAREIQILLNQTIKKVSDDIEAMRFNTAVSTLMIMSNAWEKEKEINQDDFEKYLILLSPFAPHMSSELWQKYHKEPIEEAKWPIADKKLLTTEKITLPIQINGKVRGSIEVSADISEKEALEEAKNHPDIDKWLSGKEVKKVVFVSGRLLSLVI